MAELEQLEARVERDRLELTRSLDDLSDMLAPDQLAADLNLTVEGYLGEVGRQAVTTAKENPAAFALVGAGLALLLTGPGRQARSTQAGVPPADATDGSDDPVTEADDAMRTEQANRPPAPTARKLRATLDLGLEALPPAARRRVLKARNAALEAQERLEANARRAASKARRFHNDRPLAVGAIALGLGAVLGNVLPGTSREDALLGKRRDALLAEARRALTRELAALKASTASRPDRVADLAPQQTGRR